MFRSKTAQPSKEQLMQFAVAELGGEAALLERFWNQQLRSAISNRTKTLGDLVKQAETEGWIEGLNGCTLRQLGDLLSGGGTPADAKGKTGGKRAKIKRAQADHIRGALLEQLNRSKKQRTAKDLFTQLMSQPGIKAINAEVPVTLPLINTLLKKLVAEKAIIEKTQPRPKPTLYSGKRTK